MKYAISQLQGLYIGQLDPDELLLFEAAVEAGIAFRDYSGRAGFLGCAKVGVR